MVKPDRTKCKRKMFHAEQFDSIAFVSCGKYDLRGIKHESLTTKLMVNVFCVMAEWGYTHARFKLWDVIGLIRALYYHQITRYAAKSAIADMIKLGLIKRAKIGGNSGTVVEFMPYLKQIANSVAKSTGDKNLLQHMPNSVANPTPSGRDSTTSGRQPTGSLLSEIKRYKDRSGECAHTPVAPFVPSKLWEPSDLGLQFSQADTRTEKRRFKKTGKGRREKRQEGEAIPSAIKTQLNAILGYNQTEDDNETGETSDNSGTLAIDSNGVVRGGRMVSTESPEENRGVGEQVLSSRAAPSKAGTTTTTRQISGKINNTPKKRPRGGNGAKARHGSVEAREAHGSDQLSNETPVQGLTDDEISLLKECKEKLESST